jgi:outer membrane protein OmpA-like peptidoglycan-associated protein
MRGGELKVQGAFMRKSGCIFIILFLILAAPLPGTAGDGVHIKTPGFQSQIAVESVANPQQVAVSVLGPDGEPIRGLGPQDFAMGVGIHKARIVSVEPLLYSQPTPVNLVMVIDNSLSVKERGTVDFLLAALEGLLKDVRPIDNVRAIVFSDRGGPLGGGRSSTVRPFRAGQSSDWKRFFAEVFDRGITTKTYLYDAIMGGIDAVKTLPSKEKKLMVVFAAGEDHSSWTSRTEIENETRGIRNFQIFCIDYMRAEKTDQFLTSLAEDHLGRVWKARSAAELVPIFQDLKNAILRNYLLTYELLNPIAFEPKVLSLEVPSTTTGAPATNMVFFPTGKSEIPNAYVQFTTSAEAEAFKPDRLSGASTRYFNILNFVGKALRDLPEARIGIVGCTSDTGPEKGNLPLSQDRAEAVKEYLRRIWGIDAARMLIEARHLPADPSPDGTRDGRLENQRVEFFFDSDEAQSRAAGSLIAESSNHDAVQVKLDLHSLPDVANSELLIQSNGRTLEVVSATAAPRPLNSFRLDDLGRDRLARLNSMEAVVRLTDANGRVYEAASDLCQIKAKPQVMVSELALPLYGVVKLEPKTVTVEEITVIDRSPLLNHIYFETGRSDIPGRYALFTSPIEAKAFDPAALKGTMEKYRQVLNIIGQRTAERPKARLKIVGCHSGFGEEKGRVDLSRSRAESVRNYLRTIWGIDSSRLGIEARGLPTAATAASLPEGRAENQRVEIYSDDPAIIDTVSSTFIEARSDAETFRITPEIEPGAVLKRWNIEIFGDEQRLDGLAGEGELDSSYVLALNDVGLLNIGSYQSVSVVWDAEDAKGLSLRARDACTVQFVKREERRMRREGYPVVERYALILFDFDRAEIRDRNRIVMDRIAKRIREVPSATVKIVGHTDTIGAVDHNMSLSKRRAETVYSQVLAGGAAGRERVSFEGKGPFEPIFDNGLPEGRAFNRTVTIILEYEQQP